MNTPLLLFFFLAIPFVHCSCPTGFELVRDGECRGLHATMSLQWNQAEKIVEAKCKEINGLPVIIHNSEHQSYWSSRRNLDYVFVLGLKCNSDSLEWKWVDGSDVDYKPHSYWAELDQKCTVGSSWVLEGNGSWGMWSSHNTLQNQVFCTTQLQQPTGDGCDGFDDDSDDSECYQISATAQNWQDAQTTCRNIGATVASIHNPKENSFIRRSAVAAGAVNGMYIGATSSGNGKQYGWKDGSSWDYENFSPGFPVDGHGDCLAMDTFSASGQWMNMDCSSKLAVACARKAEPRPTCTAGPWKEGQVIYSPGYPYDASVPCDYYISVPAGKKVRVEVLQLEANTCCDRLVMEDDVLGGNIVANLTGELTDQFYTTSSSNFMRVSWQPNGGMNVRGIMFSFTGV